MRMQQDINDGTGLAPYPRQVAPPAPAPAPAPAPKPPPPVPAALKPPAPAPAPKAPAVAPKAPTAPATGQTAPVIGAPTGYDISKGVDDTAAGLMPDGFDVNDLKGAPIADATTPAAQTYIDQEQDQAQGPTDWVVDPSQTVAGQYAALSAQGSALMQAAQEKAVRSNAAAGGRNSLMAQSAGALAGAQVAMTTAQQDAATNAAAGQFNAAAANTFSAQQNAFIQQSLSSQQSFDQGVAMLKDQTNQNIETLYAQVEANAATQATNLKATLGQIQAQTNATLETMDKQFAQTTATAAQTQDYANQNANTNYGMQVRMAYLTNVQNQQNALMQTIGEIRSNPNINSTQAASAVQDAIDQFNSFMTMGNTYYSAMMPGQSGATGTTPGGYDSASYDYGSYNASNFPKVT